MKLGTSGSTESLIAVRNVSKTYVRGSEKIQVLEGLNLDVEKGDFVAFMGPSGSGKTTLLNLLGGLQVGPFVGPFVLDPRPARGVVSRSTQPGRCRGASDAFLGFMGRGTRTLPCRAAGLSGVGSSALPHGGASL